MRETIRAGGTKMTGHVSYGQPVLLVRGPSCATPETVYTSLSNAGVDRLYPGFEAWFTTKVVPGLRSGERRIFTSVVDGELAGIAICKRSVAEDKLCTLWVSPHVRRLGIASSLAVDAFAWLGTDRPLFTVPEELLAEFRNLLNGWGFTRSIEQLGLYRSGRVEHVFNYRKG